MVKWALSGVRLKRAALILYTFAAAALMAVAGPAAAQSESTPAETIGTAPLLTPSAVDSYYGSATTSTNAMGYTSRPPEVVELARALAGNSAADPANPSDAYKTADRIYQYVLNNIDVVWLYGLQKGSVGTIIDHAGTPFDQAMLMVELLRQDGFTAAYQVGQITLTGTQFYDWTGIQNAQAVCQLLSNGSIGAVINGSTDSTCASYASTNVTSVTMNHVWVSVSLGGTTYYFDPAFKAHLHKTGINLASTAGMTAGAPLSAAASGMTSATDSGTSQPYVQNLNGASLNTAVQGYGAAILTYIKAHPEAQMVDVLGGDVIARYEVPAGGLRQTSISYAASTQHTWTGSIPDQYRTTLRLQQNVGGISPGTSYPQALTPQTQIWNKSFYVDEIYGRKLTAGSVFNPNDSDPSVFNASLNVTDETGQGVAGAPATVAAYSGHIIIPLRNGALTMTVNHPYAASADGTATTHGDYMDSVIVKQTNLAVPFTVVHAWGDASGLDKYYGSRNDTVLPARIVWCDCDPANGMEAGDGKRESLAASWIVQSSKAARLHASVASSIYQLHHAVGVVSGDTFLGMYSQPQNATYMWSTTIVPTPQSFYTILNAYTRIDVDAGFSLASKTADPVARRAAIFSIAATTDALEGSVLAQQSDLPDTTSTATRFDWGNAPPAAEDLYTKGPRRFFTFTPSTSSTNVSSVIKVEGRNDYTTTDSCGSTSSPSYAQFAYPGGAPTMCSDFVKSYSSSIGYGQGWLPNYANAITTYTAAGFTVSASEDAHLGPGQPFGTPAVWNFGQANLYTPQASFQRGGAFVAVKYASNGLDPNLIAHVVVGTTDGGDFFPSKGGGGGVQPDNQLTFDPAKAADILKTRFVDHSSALGVDLATGGVGYTPPVQLSIGNGEFPYKLTAQFIWTGGNAAAPERPADTDYAKFTDPGTPWTTNWHSRLAVGSSGIEALGASDPRAAAGTIGAFLAMQDIYKASPSIQRDVAGVLVNSWWVKQVAGNTVTATLGAGSRQFVQLVDGTWITPGAGPTASLTVTGARVICGTSCYGGVGGTLPYPLSRGWDYSPMSFAVTNAQGDVQHYSYWRNNMMDGKHRVVLNGFRLSTWTFPQGVTVTVNYGPNSALPTTVDTILSVSNSLGRQINFVNQGEPDPIYGYAGGFNNNLTGSDARSVSATQPAGANSGIYTFTDQMGVSTTVYANVVPWNQNINNGGDFRFLLNKIYTADNPPLNINAPANAASLQYDYDSLRRVKQAWDGDALQLGTHAAYQFFVADHVRGERMDPLGASFAVEYDLYRQPLEYFDELGREVSETHDSRGRTLATTYPEGDAEQFVYDDRNNTLSLTKVAKPGSGLSNIVESATWDSTWNKPLTITDGLGNVTTFTYQAAGTSGAGEMHTATRPADVDGNHPVYSFTYSSVGKLLTSTDPTGVVTQNTFDTTYGNLLTTAVDPSHINSVSSFSYDANGAVISTTDPRSNVSNVTYDLDGRKIFEIAPDPDGAGALLRPATRSIYDALGRVIETDKGRTTTATGSDFAVLESATTAYDPDSKKIKEVTPAGVTQFSYDGDDRLTCAAVRMFPGGYASLPASACTLGTTNPSTLPDRITETVYDAAGQSLQTIQAYGTSAQRTYATYDYCAYDPTHTYPHCTAPGAARNNDGEAIAVTDSNGNLTLSVYDGFNRLTSMQFPSTTRGAGTADTTDHEDYTYDAGGNRLTLTKRDQLNQLLFTYDNLNRPIVKDAKSITPPGPLPEVLTYTDYDLAGRPTHIHYASRTGTGVDYAYDTAGRLTSETTFSKAMAFQYDVAHNRSRVTWPDSFYAAYSYDADNRLISVGENGATSGIGLLATFTYDDLGRRTALTRGNGTSTSYSYDGADRLTALGHTLVTTTANQTWAFGYNQASQKIARTSSNSLYEWTPPSPATVNKTYDGLNRDATIAATTGGYDANGNLTFDGTRTFTYDRENRLLSASAPTAVTLAYDPTGRLNRTTAGSMVTGFLYDGMRLLAEYDGSGSLLRRYVHSDGGDEPIVWYEGSGTANRQWLHQDPQGSVVAWSDASGSVTSSQIYAYGPYGEPGSWTGSRFRYTGQIMIPEAQLYSYKARVYDPMTGRFLQTDPIGYKDDLDWYVYVGADPVNHIDPSGKRSFIVGRPVIEPSKAATTAFRAAILAGKGPIVAATLATAAYVVAVNTKHAFLVVTQGNTSLADGKIVARFSFGPSPSGGGKYGSGDTTMLTGTNARTDATDRDVLNSFAKGGAGPGVASEEIKGVSNETALAIFGAKSDPSPYLAVPGATSDATNSNSEAFSRGEAAAKAGGSTFTAPEGSYPGDHEASRVKCPVSSPVC